MKRCQECGKEHEGAFCPYCGAKWTAEQATERICPDCGATVAPGMRFCSECGYDFTKKQSSEEVRAERRVKAAEERAAHFMEAIPSMLRIGNALLAVLFSLTLWLLFALPVTSLLGTSIGNLYQFMSGTTALGELLPGIGALGWAIALALVASFYSFIVLCVLIGNREDKRAHMKHVAANFSFLIFHVIFFIVGCVIASKVAGYGLAVGGCATALMIASGVFAVLSLALSVASYNMTKQAQEPLTPEEEAERERKRALRSAKRKKILDPVSLLAVAGVTVLIIVSVSTNIFRAGKVDNIVIGADEAAVLDVLGEPYIKAEKGEYANAEHDTVWKYYSRNYVSHHEKIAKLREAEDLSSLGALADAVDELSALNEKSATLRYKYIEVAFKDGDVVAVYLDKDRCDGNAEAENAPISMVSAETFSYVGCDGGGKGSTRLTVKFKDGSYFNDYRSVETDRFDLTWTDKKGTHTTTVLHHEDGLRWTDQHRSGVSCKTAINRHSEVQHTVETWITTKAPTCTEQGIETGECIYCCNSFFGSDTVTREIPATGHSGAYETMRPATCTQNGVGTLAICEACGAKNVEISIPATGHQNQNGTCAVCNFVLSLGDSKYIRVNADGTKNTTGSYILFGEYPQSIKLSSVTVTSTTDSRGYYLGSDGFYYAKVTADPYISGYTFSTGDTVTSGSVYYFKVEPIRWRILSEEGNAALILCDSIIASHRYDYDSNNYAESEIRAWLNEQFYNTAFDSLQRELILTTTVDNSVASTGYSQNEYACENTSDKIFLLSYKEVTNTAYGFSSSYTSNDTARRIQTSDCTRATGAYMSTSSSYYGNGWWWLRSPNGDDSSSARGVNNDGDVYGNYDVNSTPGGVVPALQIRLK